ncbi:MAG: isoleucine--tRNA ligase [Candidatus Shapirobacteria bacterium]|jgi:isoleucyl-tRNA synthetase
MAQKNYKKIPQNVNFASLEQEIIDFWKANHSFEKSIDQRPLENVYTFYDGPPFITGSPHHGSLLPSIAKDVIPRFWTMKGKRVRRVWGWDCHGLPTENKVEEKLGLKTKKDIETIGIRRYIDECYAYVKNVSQEWEWYIDHIGRWVDFNNSYKTMDLKYMESVMWAFSQLYKKDLIYKSRRTSLYCPRCATPLSNFEIAMDNSYRMVEDPAISIKFKLTDSDAFILAWTTTPWTLPGNLALAIDQDQDYVKVDLNGEHLILAKSRLDSVLTGQNYRVIEEFKGSKLVGKSYEPLYRFFETGPNDYKIYNADLVSMEEGTGVVHIAPGFGDEDFNLGKLLNLSIIDHVDDEGKIIDQVAPFAGLFVKKADPVVIEELTSRHLLFKVEKITHSYPFCYRCGTPLIYKSQTAWYLRVSQLKPGMKETNEAINWIPDHIKHGRFGQGIETAPDWCLSRSRYWASPIPVWECSCGFRFVPESIQELETKSGQKITNLHKPEIDEVVVKCHQCGKDIHRVPEVLDCWFESGSMPYAQIHYPFENKEQFNKEFPADYIIEYIAQTRGWFYTLHVLANGLFGSASFKNCIVTGVIMGTDGRKMSKLYKNYPDPKMILQKYGAEALRLYFMGSVVMIGENINIDEKEIEDKVKNILLPLWNSFKYFLTYAQLNEWIPKREVIKSTNVLDLWILNKVNEFSQNFEQALTAYQIPNAVRLVQPFIEDLSRWYIRQSRDRFVNGDIDALQTLWLVLVQYSKTTAPLIPFITEYFWQTLVVPFDPKASESIHLESYPLVTTLNTSLSEAMGLVRQICEQGNMARKTQGISTRQPLASINVKTTNPNLLTSDLVNIIKNELNVKSVKVESADHLTVDLDTILTPDLIAEGDFRDLVRNIQVERKKMDMTLKDRIIVYAPDWPKTFESEILAKTQAESIRKADTFYITKV